MFGIAQPNQVFQTKTSPRPNLQVPATTADNVKVRLKAIRVPRTAEKDSFNPHPLVFVD